MGEEKVTLHKTIKLKNLYFSYVEDKLVLNNVSLEIEKGSKIGFIGESGSGKSTLVDIIMGLYRPKKGSIFIDDALLSDENVKSWRSRIGYIPQHIYLFDGTIAQNVAFDEEYDEQRVKETLKKANLLEFLESRH